MQTIDYVTITISVIALIVSSWAAWVVLRQTRSMEKDTTLKAYEMAIRGILDLKKSFAENPQVFDQQMNFEPDMKKLIPSYMDIPTFLTFASGMWRLSFVYTAMKRGKEMGLNEKELEGIKREMVLWLRDVPGFYDIYVQHTQVLNVHNKDFLEFLENDVYDTNYRRSAEPKRLARLNQSRP